MMNEIRPIDASELLSKAEIAPMYAVDAMVCYNLIESAPTLDYAPVIHAHWVPCVTHYECSRCHNVEEFCEPYCHCGAKMDERDPD